ncbi:hypothetical protein AJ88_35235 [Mesorhizobium amorphae CCBAU 01583]|nr:hypothetical protein AJ88_35235 [Mesorhizobium amorphae CCBAU 01583]
MVGLKAGVAKAIEGFRNHFPDNHIEVCATADGAAFVIVEDVPLGPPYQQANTWVGFFLSTACPDDDTYPFYVRGDLARLDKAMLKNPLHPGKVFPDAEATMSRRASVMVSRRQRNQSCWSYEPPLLKLLTVIKWMLQQ